MNAEQDIPADALAIAQRVVAAAEGRPIDTCVIGWLDTVAIARALLATAEPESQLAASELSGRDIAGRLRQFARLWFDERGSADLLLREGAAEIIRLRLVVERQKVGFQTIHRQLEPEPGRTLDELIRDAMYADDIARSFLVPSNTTTDGTNG